MANYKGKCNLYQKHNLFVLFFTAGTSAQTTDRTLFGASRKRFKPSREEEDILRGDQQANEAMSRAYQRATEFGTTLKAIITWHEKHP